MPSTCGTRCGAAAGAIKKRRATIPHCLYESLKREYLIESLVAS